MAAAAANFGPNPQQLSSSRENWLCHGSVTRPLQAMPGTAALPQKGCCRCAPPPHTHPSPTPKSCLLAAPPTPRIHTYVRKHTGTLIAPHSCLPAASTCTRSKCQAQVARAAATAAPAHRTAAVVKATAAASRCLQTKPLACSKHWIALRGCCAWLLPLGGTHCRWLGDCRVDVPPVHLGNHRGLQGGAG